MLHRQALQQQQQNDNPDHDGVDGDAAHNNINGASATTTTFAGSW
jgi:hypothetical protein